MFYRMTRQFTEGAAIAGARMVYGDVAVAEWGADNLTPRQRRAMADRHTEQYKSLMKSTYDHYTDDEFGR